MQLQIHRQLLAHDRLHDTADLGITQLLLGLAFELRLQHPAGNDGRQAFFQIIRRKGHIFLLEQIVGTGKIVQYTGKPGPETSHMGTAFRRVDVVDVADHALRIILRMLKSNFDLRRVLFATERDDIRINRRPILIQKLDIPNQAVIGRKDLVLFFPGTLVRQRQGQALRQEGHLAHPLLQRLIVKLRHAENRRVRQERHSRSMSINISRTGPSKRNRDLSLGKLHAPDGLVALTGNVHLEPLRQSVHNRCTDTMQTACTLITAAAKLTAGVQLGQYDLQGGLARLRVGIYGNTAPVITNRYGIICMDRHVNLMAKTSHRLIYAVIQNFIHQMMKSTLRRRTNVHARPAPDCFQTLQDLNILGIIIAVNLHRHFVHYCLSFCIDFSQKLLCVFILIITQKDSFIKVFYQSIPHPNPGKTDYPYQLRP